MKSKEYISFKKMIEYIDKPLKYTAGYTFEQFCEDEKTVVLYDFWKSADLTAKAKYMYRLLIL